MSVTQIRLDTQSQDTTLTPNKVSTNSADNFTFPGNVTINGTDVNSTLQLSHGGGLTLTTPNGTTVPPGGNITLTAGNASSSGTSTGGSIILTSGTSNGVGPFGGSITLTTGDAFGGQVATGGSITLTTFGTFPGGETIENGNGGGLTLTTGDCYAGAGVGGNLTLTTGTIAGPGSSGQGGSIILTTGPDNFHALPHSTNLGGSITLTAYQPTNGGSIVLTGTGANGTPGAPAFGNIYANFLNWIGGLQAAGSNSQIQFNNNGVMGADANFIWNTTNEQLILSGDPTNPSQGSIILTKPGPFPSSGDSLGGGITLTAGEVVNSNSEGGNIVLTAGNHEGNASGHSKGGSITLTSGSSTSKSVIGGSILLTTGSTIGSITGGDITITASAPSAGGSLYLTGNGATRGQVAVGTLTPDASASVDVTSTTRGFLLPRMTSTQFTSIASPATGLLAYATDLNLFVYYNGTSYGEFPVATLAGGTTGSVQFNGGGGSFAGGTGFTFDSGTNVLTLTQGGIVLGNDAPITMYDSTIGSSNFVTIQNNPGGTITSYTMNLPRKQGNANTVLTNDGAGNLSWGPLSNLVTTTATTYTVLATDYTVLGDATSNNIAITSPSASGNTNRILNFKKLDSSANTVTITPSAGTIDGAASVVLGTQYQSVSIQSDGTNWWIL